MMKAGDLEVFALCPFNPDYLRDTWPLLRTMVRGLGAGKGKFFDARPVTEYLSPMLVGERLYDLARFADRCLVDWTKWRADVFFELGVRLAVNPVLPISVVDADGRKTGNASAALVQTFSPIPYDLSGDTSEFGSAFLRVEEQISDPRHVLNKVNQVYAAAERNAAVDQELGSVPLEQELVAQVKSIIGPDLGRAGRLALLYHGNSALEQQVWQNSVDRLEVALLLADSKSKASPSDEDRLRFTQLAGDIRSMLRELQDLGRQRSYGQRGEAIDVER